MTPLLNFELTWRVGFGILAASNLSLAAVYLFTRKRWTLPHEEQTPEAPAQSLVKARETLKLPIVWITLLTFFLYTGLEIGLGQWSFTIALESRALPENTAGLWTALYWGGLTAGRIILGFIETNTERLVRLTLFVVVAGAAAFALNLSPTVSLIGLVMVGFGLAPIFPSLIALTPSRIGSDHASNAIGFQIGAAGVGGAILPGLAGVLGDSFGLELIAVFFFIAAFLLLISEATAARASRKTLPQTG
jgi:fucose permease